MSSTRRQALVSGLSAVASIAAVATFVWLFANRPSDFRNVWGVSFAGARAFAITVPWVSLPPLATPESFVWFARCTLILAWLAWTVMVVSSHHRPALSQNRTLGGCVAVIAVFAIFAPPVLSNDAFSYVAYGRLSYVHGLNPYEHGRAALAAAGDPSAEFLVWPTLMPYGPLWPLLIRLLGPLAAWAGGFFGEVLLHKVLAGAGHLAAAVFISRVAESRRPGLGGPAMLALGLNPLLLLEGPVNGHNDFIAIGLVAWAAAWWHKERTWVADLVIGLAVATKPTALGVLPLVLLARWHDGASSDKWRRALVAAVLVVTPAVALSIFFGGPFLLAEVVAGRLDLVRPRGAIWVGRAILTAACVWGTTVVLRSHNRNDVSWVSAWVIVSTVIFLTGTTVHFPWYAAWPLAPAMAAATERDRMLLMAVSICAFLLMWLYTVSPA